MDYEEYTGKPELRVFARRLGERIQDIEGMTGKKLAKISGIAPGSISAYCQGNTPPGMLHLKALARALNVSTDYLIGLTKDEEGRADVMAVEKRLGLDPKAQDSLSAWLENKNNALDIINLLMTDPDGIGIVVAIADYLNEDCSKVVIQGMEHIPSSDFRNIFLVDVWKSLIRLRDDPDSMYVVPFG